MTMRAAILECDRRAVLQAIEHDRLAQNDAAERLAPDLVVIGCDVPIVSEEHGAFLRPPDGGLPLRAWYAPTASFSMQ